jgi:hypothetical protein
MISGNKGPLTSTTNTSHQFIGENKGKIRGEILIP